MSNDPSLLQAIEALRDDIQSHLTLAREGGVVDISLFPDRLLSLHNRVKDEEPGNKEVLSAALKEVLDSLDTLAAEIRLRYKELSTRIDQIEGNEPTGTKKEKFPKEK